MKSMKDLTKRKNQYNDFLQIVPVLFIPSNVSGLNSIRFFCAQFFPQHFFPRIPNKEGTLSQATVRLNEVGIQV